MAWRFTEVPSNSSHYNLTHCLVFAQVPGGTDFEHEGVRRVGRWTARRKFETFLEARRRAGVEEPPSVDELFQLYNIVDKQLRERIMMAFWAAVNSPVRRDGDSYEGSLDLLRRGGGSVEGQERAETAFEWLARSGDWRAIKSNYDAALLNVDTFGALKRHQSVHVNEIAARDRHAEMVAERVQEEQFLARRLEREARDAYQQWHQAHRVPGGTVLAMRVADAESFVVKAMYKAANAARMIVAAGGDDSERRSVAEEHFAASADLLRIARAEVNVVCAERNYSSRSGSRSAIKEARRDARRIIEAACPRARHEADVARYKREGPCANEVATFLEDSYRESNNDFAALYQDIAVEYAKYFARAVATEGTDAINTREVLPERDATIWLAAEAEDAQGFASDALKAWQQAERFADETAPVLSDAYSKSHDVVVAFAERNVDELVDLVRRRDLALRVAREAMAAAVHAARVDERAHRSAMREPTPLELENLRQVKLRARDGLRWNHPLVKQGYKWSDDMVRRNGRNGQRLTHCTPLSLVEELAVLDDSCQENVHRWASTLARNARLAIQHIKARIRRVEAARARHEALGAEAEARAYEARRLDEGTLETAKAERLSLLRDLSNKERQPGVALSAVVDQAFPLNVDDWLSSNKRLFPDVVTTSSRFNTLIEISDVKKLKLVVGSLRNELTYRRRDQPFLPRALGVWDSIINPAREMLQRATTNAEAAVQLLHAARVANERVAQEDDVQLFLSAADDEESSCRAIVNIIRRIDVSVESCRSAFRHFKEASANLDGVGRARMKLFNSFDTNGLCRDTLTRISPDSFGINGVLASVGGSQAVALHPVVGNAQKIGLRAGDYLVGFWDMISWMTFGPQTDQGKVDEFNSRCSNSASAGRSIEIIVRPAINEAARATRVEALRAYDAYVETVNGLHEAAANAINRIPDLECARLEHALVGDLARAALAALAIEERATRTERSATSRYPTPAAALMGAVAKAERRVALAARRVVDTVRIGNTARGRQFSELERRDAALAFSEAIAACADLTLVRDELANVSLVARMRMVAHSADDEVERVRQEQAEAAMAALQVDDLAPALGRLAYARRVTHEAKRRTAAAAHRFADVVCRYSEAVAELTKGERFVASEARRIMHGKVARSSRDFVDFASAIRGLDEWLDNSEDLVSNVVAASQSAEQAAGALAVLYTPQDSPVAPAPQETASPRRRTRTTAPFSSPFSLFSGSPFSGDVFHVLSRDPTGSTPEVPRSRSRERQAMAPRRRWMRRPLMPNLETDGSGTSINAASSSALASAPDGPRSDDLEDAAPGGHPTEERSPLSTLPAASS